MDRNEIIAYQRQLEKRILNGTITAHQVEREIEKIEKKYGADAFYPCKATPKEKPWSIETLQELDELFQFGAQSKECLRYMALVSDEVYHAKRLKKIILMSILVVLACALLVMGLYLVLQHSEV